MAKANKSQDSSTESSKANVSELSKSELYNDAVDQTTGEVKKGQPGGSEGTAVSDRPTMTEQEAREINGYAGFENVAEQREHDPSKPSEQDYDTLVKKS